MKKGINKNRNKIKNTGSKKSRAYNYGKYAENFACLYLRLKGYKIIERRFKTKMGEIDLIAINKNRLVFVEVKARKGKNIDEVLLKQQMTRIINASSFFIIKNKKFTNYSVRFDLIIVRSFFRLEHIKNAWENYEYTHL